MLAHCKDYIDSVGDHPLNMASTNLGVNAFALTQENKYRDWVMEYIGAWKERTEQCNGNIPTNVGRDGKPGGEYNGQWWKGTYGWNFTIYDGELEETASRNTFTAGAWPGFANALMLTGDQSFVGVLRRQMDNIYAQKKVENGKTLLPQMYGDPKGYHENGVSELVSLHGQSVSRPPDRDLLLVDGPEGPGTPADERVRRLPGRQGSGLSGASAAARSRIRTRERARHGCRTSRLPTLGWLIT